jgi:hypothetical protein
MSSCRVSSETDSRTVLVATKNAMMPIGTFRKNTDPHPRCSTIRPPTVGPRASARPDMPAHRPIALARSWGGNVTVMMESVPGMSSAPPTPWSARKPISHEVEGESAHPNDASVNRARPPKNIFFRPYRSPRIPPVSRSEAKAST